MLSTYRFKTWFFLLALTALVLFLGQAIGGRQGLLIAFILTTALNFLSYFFSDQIVLWTYGAQPLEGADPYGLNDMVERIAKKAAIPKPKVFIIPTETPNAFATGRSPQNSSIAATQGILKLLSKEEIEGVLAHELSHVSHQDTFIMMIAATMGSVVMYLAHIFQWTALFGRPNNDKNNPGGAVSSLLGAVIAPVAATLIQLAVSRNREYLADAGAVQLTGNPQALASALWKIHNYAHSMPLPATVATSHLFIINPLSTTGLNALFSTHPPVEERIKRLTGRTP
jgi:heat shock protein HtpX